MKIVINTCFGGFGLSPEATLELWKRGGPVEAHAVDTYFSKDDGAFGKTKSLNDWRKYLAGDREEISVLFLHVFSPDEKFVLTAEHGDEFRSNEKLVALVEEMGEKANGRCSSLSVVEIPDGVDYEISEYDGNEHIAEKHRTWS